LLLETHIGREKEKTTQKHYRVTTNLQVKQGRKARVIKSMVKSGN